MPTTTERAHPAGAPAVSVRPRYRGIGRSSSPAAEQHRTVRSRRTVAAVAQVATPPLALPEVRAAVRRLRGRS